LEISGYVIAWLVYLLAAVGIVIVFWRMTGNITWRRTRRSLRAVVAAVLFTPINIEHDEMWLAPAYLVGFYDWILGHHEKALEAGAFMLYAFALMIVVILLESVLRRLLGMERA
jgi:hypothetical protein